MRAGGGFSENRDGGAPLAVSGSNSTFNNTDTSAATTLPPASDAQSRDAQSGYSETGGGQGGQDQKYPEAAGGQPDFAGRHTTEGYSGGPTSAKRDLSDTTSSSAEGVSSGGGESYAAKTSSSNTDGAGDTNTSSTGGTNTSSIDGTNTSSTGGTNTSTSTTGGGSSGNVDVDAAPSYVTPVVAESGGKPHGKNLTEGGFDAEGAPNASFTTDIGSKDDPGRAAEDKFELQNESVAGGTGPRQAGEGNGAGVYDQLGQEEKL